MEEKSMPLGELCAALEGHRLPAWQELPDLELYMDQVLALVERYLGDYPGYDSKGLTASMVNNYVKLGALPAPQKKKYKRGHLARLIMICVLKSVLPIAAVQRLIDEGLRESTEEDFYGCFCTLFERAGKAAALGARELPEDAARTAVLGAALRAQAEQALAKQFLVQK